MGKIIMSLLVLGMLGTVAYAGSSAQVGQLSDINAQLQKNGADQNYGDMQQGLDGFFSGSGAKAKNNDTPVYMDQSKAADHTQHCPGCPGSPTPASVPASPRAAKDGHINTAQPWLNNGNVKPTALKMSVDGRIGYATTTATCIPSLKTESVQKMAQTKSLWGDLAGVGAGAVAQGAAAAAGVATGGASVIGGVVGVLVAHGADAAYNHAQQPDTSYQGHSTYHSGQGGHSDFDVEKSMVK